MNDVIQPFDLVERAAKDNPHKLALTSGKAQLTFLQLRDFGKQLGQVMRRRGVHPGDIIGVNLPSVLRCAASVAIAHEAAVSVPLTPALVHDNYIGMKWLIVDKPINSIPIEQQFVVDAAFLKRLKSVAVTASPRDYATEDTLYRVAMSSGTTGRPKAIPLSVSQNHERAIESISRWAGDSPFMSLMFPKNGTGWHAWHTSLARQETYLVPGERAMDVFLMNKFNTEAVMGSPAQISVLMQAIEYTKIALPKLRVIQSGGSQLTPSLFAEVKRVAGLEVGNAYSSTEMGSVAHRLGHHDDTSYMGQLTTVVETQIVDPETDEEVPNGEFGVIRLRRPNMVTEYLFAEEATAKHFRNGWFYPGDTGKIVDGGLYLGARESEIINAGGMKVDPVGVDSAILRQPGVVDGAAFAWRDNLELENVGAAVVFAEGTDQQEFAAALKRELGSWAPVRIFPVPEIPRNEWGKAVRRALTEKLSAQPKG